MLKSIKSETGHTVVEMLVALAILTIALVPTVQFMARVMSNAGARDLVVATQLARDEMERVISERDFMPDEKRIRVNQQLWQLATSIEVYAGLVQIYIKVYKKNSSKPMVELQTSRLLHD